MNIKASLILSEIKKRLINKGHGKSIELLQVLEKLEPDGFEKWLLNGSTILLFDISRPYSKYSIYDQRTDKYPFFNDQCHIDSAHLHVISNQ